MKLFSLMGDEKKRQSQDLRVCPCLSLYAIALGLRWGEGSQAVESVITRQRLL